MKELVKVIAVSLVDHPDEIVVTEKDDMGKVIGKQGRIAKAIRTVVKAAASRDDKKVIVDIAQ